MHAPNNDQGFDNFRRERKRIQSKMGPTRVLGYENQALRELEEVEAREVRDQQLTREVHEFFAAATKQAAGIVERVAKDAQAEAGLRVEQEMESFLIDALARMNSLVVNVMQQKRPPIAAADMEPRIGNLVGESLDEFRWAGTADIADKHIGQDPFDTDVDEVRREFREACSLAQVEGEVAPESIEEHLVAEVQSDVEGQSESTAEASPDTGEAEATTQAEPPLAPRPEEELERFKTALKALVKQGTMTRDEARAAWQTRLKALGLVRA
jgi:hypothetical protein